MALIRESDRNRDFREGKIIMAQKLARLRETALEHKAVGRGSFGLFESARKMMEGKARGRGQRIEADIPIQMRFDVVAYAAQG